MLIYLSTAVPDAIIKVEIRVSLKVRVQKIGVGKLLLAIDALKRLLASLL